MSKKCSTFAAAKVNNEYSMKKHILGLDLGTNSIGWAVVTEEDNQKRISCAGSRIIPMDAKLMGDFESGNSISQTKDRTQARGIRRLYERHALRRERLNRVLTILSFLPDHYTKEQNRYGQLNKGAEPKLAWDIVDGKYSFLFKSSFLEMVKEFRNVHPELLVNGRNIAYDWTIYYLRKKALTQPISKQELAWILQQFNQKRGYNQARGEEEEQKENKRQEFITQKVISVRDTGEKSKGKPIYEVCLENGWSFTKESKYPLDWEGKTKNFIVSTTINSDGTDAIDKDGKVRRTFRAPADDDWGLLKLKTQHDIDASHKTIGEFIYDALLQNPDQKIIGQLVRVVDRKYYKDELKRILDTQKQFIHELQNGDLYDECIHALYPQNDAYRNSIAGKDFTYLLLNDIILYQRPLKSKKSLINECPYEYHVYKDKEGKWQRQYLKCISKSHPIYEEFRLWQFVENLHIYREAANGIGKEDCTTEYIANKAELISWLLTQKEVSEKSLLTQLVGKNKIKGLSWNFVSENDKKYPAAPVSSTIIGTIIEAGGDINTLTDPFEIRKNKHHRKLSGKEQDEKAKKNNRIINNLEQIWHMLYSISDKSQLLAALKHYAETNHLSDVFVEKLGKMKPFSDYGAYSEKATRKLLNLMRSGECWSEDAIDAQTKSRIEHIRTGEVDDSVSERVREKLDTMHEVKDFQGLPLWLAEYVVYDVRKNDTKWEKPEDIDKYLQSFRLHSLNNPIVEQVVMESLRTVRDIWKQEGHIDEIHIELGRDLKQNAEQRKKTMLRQQENEKANLRAKLFLQEFMNPEMDVEGVHAYSPSQQELFRIYEDGVLSANKPDDDTQRIINELSALKQPSLQDIKKYRLWLDQKYVSPYTGEIIPLAKLFTPAYQIEHVIPQSRFFDDSMSNKVICEAEVNARKDRMLAHEFIAKCGGEKITLSGGKVVQILSLQAYEDTIKKNFAGDPRKQEKLMLDEIPEKFVARQMNDSRYISRLMMQLLSNIVREKISNTEYEPEAVSKNLIVCNGTTTTRLKKDWGINDVWNKIILPRFERLNQIQNTTVFTAKTANGHIIPNVPLELKQGFEKKRIDHRHHAMDAIVIAFTTRNHVALLSNESALDKDEKARYDLQTLLRKREVWRSGDGKEHYKFTDFIAPYDGFQKDVQETLENIVVSFKQNLRVINKSNNRSIRFVDGKKQMVRQKKGENWSIRKSLHKATVFGEVNLRKKKYANLTYALQHVDDIVEKDLRAKLRELLQEGKNEKQIKQYFASEPDVWADVNLKRIEVYYYTKDTNDHYYAVRTALDESFTEDYIRNKVTSEAIQKILLAHLERCNNDPKLAFSPDGIEKMNADIQTLNNGVPHKSIYKVRTYEKAEKFAVGQIGAKSKKFVEADKGTNLFFAVYSTKMEDGSEKRSFVTIPFKAAVDCQKQGKKEWRTCLDKWVHDKSLVTEDAKLSFILSPGDLVYVPKSDSTLKMDRSRIYKFVSSSEVDAYFIPVAVASPIINKVEYSQLNKVSRISAEEPLIKEICIPIKVDRLGNIIAQ